MNNLILANLDTDSFSVCKPDQSVWTKEEKQKFQDYINSNFPELIRWADDGVYDKFLVSKSKNYAMLYFDEKKQKVVKKVKGSSFKDQKRSPSTLKFIDQIIDILLNEGSTQDIINLYHDYIKKINNITDITDWCKKVTITDKILKCKGHEKLSKEEKKEKGIRANESKVYDAIKHRHVQEGDKIYIYFKPDDTYGTLEDFNGEYCKLALMDNLYSCIKVFKNVIDIDVFVKYHLKTNKTKLEALLNETV